MCLAPACSHPSTQPFERLGRFGLKHQALPKLPWCNFSVLSGLLHCLYSMSTLLDLEAARIDPEFELMSPTEPTATEVEKVLSDLREGRNSKRKAEDQLKRWKDMVTNGHTSKLSDGGRKMRAKIATLETALHQHELDQQSKAWLTASLVDPSSELERQKFSSCCPVSQPGLLQNASAHSTQGHTAGDGAQNRLGSLDISQVQRRSSPRLESPVRSSLSLRNWPNMHAMEVAC